jgi:hypothetical protein
MHMGQYRQLGWPSGSGGLNISLEVEAQDRLLNLAARQNWTSEETFKILNNQTQWLNLQGAGQ